MRPLVCARAASGHAAEQRDEMAPFHCPLPPVLPTKRIAHSARHKTAALRKSMPKELIRRMIVDGPEALVSDYKRPPSNSDRKFKFHAADGCEVERKWK